MMARTALKLTIRELAREVAIGVNTIGRFERGETELQAGNAEALFAFFIERGVHFVDEPGLIGVVPEGDRARTSAPSTIESRSGSTARVRV